MCGSRSIAPPLVRFLWLVLAWSVLIAPNLLGAEPAPTPAAPSLPTLPAPTPDVVSPVPAALAPEYWIVSSRGSAQHPRDWSGCPLEVSYRAADRRHYQSDMGRLAGSLIPGAPVCIVVHGSFVSLEDNYVQSEEAFQAIRNAAPGLPLNVIFYTWPSNGPYLCIAPVDIGLRGQRADFNGFHVAWLMSHISEQHPVCLVGHSHGCRTVMSTLHLQAGGEVDGYCFTGYRGPRRRIRVVMAAAAFDHHWLNPGQRYDRALPRTEAVLNLQNRRDLPLAFYRLTRPFAHRAIARSGLTWRDRLKLGGHAHKVADCDVTQLLDREHYWPEYYNSSAIMSTTLPYLFFIDAAR